MKLKTLVFREETGSSAAVIRAGGLVSVPTETVYGLAGDALNEEAVKKIYEVKGRPPVKPLSIMISGKEAMPLYASPVPKAALALAEKFWPGPLTIVLKAKSVVSEIVRAGGDTVGLRCPAHPLTLRLLSEVQTALAAPSANLSGGKSPVCAEDVLAVFDGKIDAVIDGGVCSFGRESTLVDLSRKPYRILRAGAVSEEAVADALLGDMRIIGITGTTGAGKSTALEVLRQKGAFVIDCDRLYHRMLSSHADMLAELAEAFPAAVDEQGVDRQKLSEIVFRDEEALRTLNGITHRYVLAEVKRLLRECAMEGYALAAVDAVELIAGGVSALCDVTVAVLASKEKRIERIMQRDGLSRERAELRIAAQKGDEYYKQHCTYTVYNDTDSLSEAFQKQILELTGE